MQRMTLTNSMKAVLLIVVIMHVMSFVVIDKAHANDSWVHVEGGSWVLSPGTVSDIQGNIAAYVGSQAKATGRQLQEWKSYTFQYQEAGMPGNKWIFINAFCMEWADLPLHKEFVLVKDGGTCFFQLKYDPQKKRFYDLYINGEA